jgi:tetratricopeptide (TPR) repeat protein
LRRFISFISAVCLLLLIAACADTGTTRSTRRSASDRTAVPVSAAQRNDFEKALGFMKKEQYEKALPLLEAIIGENDGLPGANVNLAIAYMKLAGEGDAESYAKAEEALLRAVEVSPKNEVVQFELGLLYRKTGRFDLSRKAYEEAIKVNRNYAMAYYNLAILCDIYMQQLKCAVENFENYRKLTPEGSQQVGMWLTDLRRRAGIPEPEPAVVASEKEAE